MKNSVSFDGTPQAKIVDNYNIYLSTLSAFIFSCIGLYILLNGHPHEDAYILYIYSENLSETGVISYYQGGEPAEGATDFLWMSIIAALNFAGINTAVSALALNAVGVFLITYMSLRVGRQYGSSTIISIFLSLLIPFYVTSQAAYAGFSVALYSSLIVVLFLLSIVASGKQVALVPALGLLLALFRPDGAIFGILTSLMLLFFIRRSDLKIFFVSVTVCATIGIAYFLWRWDYFGQILPLPLIVKSQSDNYFPGLRTNLGWASNNALFIAFSAFFILSLKQGKKRIIMMSLPILAYLASLTFAVQSQNVTNRFQAPASAVLLVGSAAALFLIYEMLRNSKARLRISVISIMTIVLIIQLGINMRTTASLTRYLTNSDYINFFPYLLAEKTPKNFKVVLTEAGRFAYWLPGEKYDLVGLNTATTAVQGASPQYISTITPDLIFFHHAGTMADFACVNAMNYCHVSGEQFLEIIDKAGTLSFLGSDDRVTQAAAAAAAYISKHVNDFHLIFVRYGNSYSHVYALRRFGAVTLDDFTSSLDASFSSRGHISYFEMINR